MTWLELDKNEQNKTTQVISNLNSTFSTLPYIHSICVQIYHVQSRCIEADLHAPLTWLSYRSSSVSVLAVQSRFSICLSRFHRRQSFSTCVNVSRPWMVFILCRVRSTSFASSGIYNVSSCFFTYIYQNKCSELFHVSVISEIHEFTRRKDCHFKHSSTLNSAYMHVDYLEFDRLLSRSRLDRRCTRRRHTVNVGVRDRLLTSSFFR